MSGLSGSGRSSGSEREPQRYDLGGSSGGSLGVHGSQLDALMGTRSRATDDPRLRAGNGRRLRGNGGNGDGRSARGRRGDTRAGR